MGAQLEVKPHAVCIPYPAQGHVSPMMQLAKLLHSKGFHITYVNTEFNHKRLLKSRGPDLSNGVPDFRFESIPDGMPETDLDATQDVPELSDHIRTCFLAPFRELVLRLNGSGEVPKVTCFVIDGVTNFAQPVADELCVPKVIFWTASASGLWGYLQYTELIERGYVPLKEESYLSNGYLNTPLDWIPGMPGAQLKDIPSFIRTTNPEDIMFNFLKDEALASLKGSALILNTFDAFEQTALNLVRPIAPPMYTIGPLPTLCHTLVDPKLLSIGSSLWKEDTRCLDWLGNQETASVVYVNYGSITTMTPSQLVEFAWGLANSEAPFVWIIRPDLVQGEAALLPKEFVEVTKERGFLASWCNQEKVLLHPAVGVFLTHCGWNSMMESVCGGIPVICWPFFAEQQTNCWFACNEWGMGMEIENDVKREEVEALVREMMHGEKGKAMRAKVRRWRELSEKSVEAGGYSSLNLDRVIKEVMLKPCKQLGDAC
ncbi:hypothetical protein AMTRI_Chr13g89950 [Amborella trichopoda]